MYLSSHYVQPWRGEVSLPQDILVSSSDFRITALRAAGTDVRLPPERGVIL